MKSIKVVIEGGGHYGMGHIIRSYAFCEINNIEDIVEVYLISAKPEINLNIPFKKYKVYQDFEEIEKDDFMNTILIIDAYNFDIYYLNNLKFKYKFKVIFLADIHEVVPSCELLINHLPSINIDKYENFKIKKKLLGPNFALLRNSFYNPAKKSKSRVLICFGGTDVELSIIKLYQALIDFGFNKKNIDILYEKPISKIQKNVHFNINSEKVFNLICESEYCFITPGNISYEVFMVNRKCIMGSIYESQVQVGLSFEKIGLCKYIGDWNNIDSYDLLNWLKDSKSTIPNQKKLFSKKSKERLKKEFELITK